MKFKFLGLVAVVVIMASCSSTRTSSSTNDAYTVPDNIRTGFTTQYPTATNAVWSAYDPVAYPVDFDLNGWTPLTSRDYVVRYEMGGDSYYSYYGTNGDWVGSSSMMTNVQTLPEVIKTSINNQFSGYTIYSAQKEMWKDRMAYEVKIRNGDMKKKLLFDSNGNVLKQKDKE